jgi:eukaryotic-like serine/threonine-protein kinase
MTTERWQQINDLYHDALGLDANQQATFLSQACAGDAALRDEVESLIASHDQAGSFISEPALKVAARVLAEDRATSLVGRRFSHYRIESLLGVGGMGEVYLAEDTSLGRKVALKLLPEYFTRDAERLRRFEQEAHAASALNHPNILTIYEIGQVDGHHYMATEFIDGETLREHMAGTRMKLDESLDVATQVASALAAAHAAGIIHRDIKPENIMVRRDRIVKVLDFGLAKLASKESAVDPQTATGSAVKTNPGMVMGTVQYMSPEQARGKDVDARTDIWSLGVLLYEMVAGRAPFQGETPSHVVSVMESEPEALAHYAEMPAELERIVTKALRRNRDNRYQTANDLASDLICLKQELEVDARLKQSFETERFGSASRFAGGTANTLSVRAHPTSSAEYVINEIRRHKRVVLPVLVALAAVTAMAAYFAYARYARRDAGGSRAGTIRSIAVLPFENETNDANSEYLSDGISESLINSLSQLPGIKVSARNSSFKYKGKNADPQEVARALGVEAIMSGRVTQRNDNLLISVELVDARDRTQVWGEQYNRKATDLLAVQSEISSEIARKLRLRLTAGEQQQLAKRETVNLQAYELLLKGRFSWSKAGTENRKAALEYYRQASVADPAYALAYAELAVCYSSLINRNELEPKEFTSQAEAAARKALELDESLAEAHVAMANLKIYAWDWAVAEREIKRALELNPNLVPAHNTYALYLRIHGRREEAVAEFNRARELDPLSQSANWSVMVGLAIFRQNDQALEVAKRMLELDKSNPNLHLSVGEFYARLGRYREAIAAYQEAIKLGESGPDAQILLGAAYAKGGERDKARAILKRFETGKEYVSPVGLAILHFALGEREQGFASLEAAYAAHDQQLIWLRGEWEFDVLHDDPRFEDLVRRVGLN